MPRFTGCQCTNSVKTQELHVPPWRSDSAEDSVWPKKRPDWFTYKRVYVFDNNIGPWCTYVLVHSETVAASNLTRKDLSKFVYRRSTNELIFGKNYQKRTQAFLEIREKVEIFLKNFDIVIPKQSVENFLVQVRSEEGQAALQKMMPPPPVSVTSDTMQYLLQLS